MKKHVFFCLLLFGFLALHTEAQTLLNNRYWVKKVDSGYDKEYLDKVVKDTLSVRLKNAYFLSSKVKKENINRLTYLYIFRANIDLDFKSFPDNKSIYPFIKIDTTSLPYNVIIFKKKKYWGKLFLDKDFSDLEQMDDLDGNNKKIESRLYEFILEQKPKTLFL